MVYDKIVVEDKMGKIHNKQFIISDVDIIWDAEEWQPEEHSLFGNYRIYYDKQLSITFGKNGVLIGDAFQGDASKERNVEAVLDKDLEDVSEEYESWNGRWLLIYKNQIHLDANAQLGLFFGKIDKKHWIASSSLALINKAANGTLPMEDFFPLSLEYKTLLSWNPGPRTLLKGIRRLLPTQLLYLENDEPRIEYRDPINKWDFTGLSPEEIYWNIFEQQKNVFGHILEKYHKINIALTAGRDSRLQIAIMKKGNIPFSCHLFERQKYTKIADEKIAPIVAEKLGLEYKFITLEHGLDVSRVIDYNKHTFNNIKDMDFKWHYPYHQFDEVDGDVYVRASLYEGFCNLYKHYGMVCEYDDTIDFIMDDFCRVLKTLKGNTGAEKSLLEYCHWVKEHPTKNMTFLDMLAYEQRYGCWMSDVAQGMDLVWNGLVINPVNSMRIYSLIAGLPREKRDERVWQTEMVRMLYPEIADIPYNNEALEQQSFLKRKLKQIVHAILS